jgi:hypothetical protein
MQAVAVLEVVMHQQQTARVVLEVLAAAVRAAILQMEKQLLDLQTLVAVAVV